MAGVFSKQSNSSKKQGGVFKDYKIPKKNEAPTQGASSVSTPLLATKSPKSLVQMQADTMGIKQLPKSKEKILADIKQMNDTEKAPKSAVINVGGVPIGMDIVDPERADNTGEKVLAGVLNYGLGTVGRIFNAPAQALMNAAVNTDNLIEGKKQDWGEKSFTKDVIPKSWGNALDKFQTKHPVVGMTTRNLIEAAADPTTYIGGGIVDDFAKAGLIGKSAMKGTTENLLINAERNAKIINKMKKGILLTPQEIEIVDKTPELKQLPEAKKILALPAPAIQQPPISIKPKTLNGKFKLKNSLLENANKRLDDAIVKVQNHFGTNSLTREESRRILPDLGIDMPKLINDVEIARNMRYIPTTEEARLMRVSGLQDNSEVAKSIKNTGNFKSPLPNTVKKESIVPPRVLPTYKREFPFREIKGKIDPEKATETTKNVYGVSANAANTNTSAPSLKKDLAGLVNKGKVADGNINTLNGVKTAQNGAQEVKEMIGEIHPNLRDDEVYNDIVNGLKGSKNVSDDNIKAFATQIKDKSGLTLNLKDVYRNMRDAFGKNFDYVKKKYLDPFDTSKKAYVDEVKKYTDDIYNKVVKDLDIKKSSKESAAVQHFGEGKKIVNGKEVTYTETDLIKEFGAEKAEKIKKADTTFRQLYNEIIDKVNSVRKQIYPNNPDKLVPKRSDYYRHFKEMTEGFEGLKNIFETPSQIDPKLAGISEFVKPKSKWASFMQKRGNGAYTADAVGGFLDYIQPAAYSMHIDPHISKFRSLAKDIAEGTAETRNANGTIKWLNDFANSLAGKTNKYDRILQEDIPGGRVTFRALNWINNRVKGNQVLMNARSALSQLANIPAGVSRVKNPIAMSKGVGQTLAAIFKKGNPAIKKSQFISERYMQDLLNRFDVGLLNKPKQFAAWAMESADKLGTYFIWNSAYNKALKQGVDDAVKYADDLTRSVVAGRGIGEVPLLQQAKSFQLVAPFQLEVANLWHVMGDQVKEKDFAGIALLFMGNYLFNNVMEGLTGNRVTFDPIDALIDALSEEDKTPFTVAGRLGGEVLSNVPLGQTIASIYPEYGAKISTPLGEYNLPTRKDVFGREDPTRYGGGLLVAKGLTDPFYKLLPAYGGAQIEKTIQAAQDLNIFPKLKRENGNILPTPKKQDFPASYSSTNQGDRLRTTIDPKATSIAKGLLFGRSAIPEVKKYYDSGKTPLGVTQTENFKELVKEGFEPNKLFDALNSIRGTKKKIEIMDKLAKKGYTLNDRIKIWNIFYK